MEINKYMKNNPQDALETMVFMLEEVHRRNTPARSMNYIYELKAIIQEPIDRLIPMKPVGTYTDYRCGHCGTRVRSGKGSSSRVKDTVCRNCYQVIDWEEEKNE